MAVNDVYRVTIDQTLHNQQVLNVLYYREFVSGGATGDTVLGTLVVTNLIPPGRCASPTN